VLEHPANLRKRAFFLPIVAGWSGRALRAGRLPVLVCMAMRVLVPVTMSVVVCVLMPMFVVVPMPVPGFQMHIKLRACYSLPGGPSRVQMIALQIQLLQFLLQPVEIDPEIQQRSYEHVATDPAENIQI